MTTTDCGKMSGTSDKLRNCKWRDYKLFIEAANEIDKLRHDLANAECAARMITEAYDRMVLKYEAQLTALREIVEKLTAG